MPTSTPTASDSPTSRLDTLPPGLPRLTLGEEVLRWAMRWLVQPNGERAGKRWRPTDRQYRFVMWAYAVDEDGRWLFDHLVRRLSKGTGKSPTAAVLALCELCAPCRVRDLDPKRGVVVPRQVEMPLVQIAATAESQTSNTMRWVRALAPKGSEVVAAHRLDPGKTQYYRLPEGELKVITSSATAAEGAQPTFGIADEPELWTPTNGGVELAATLGDNLAKQGARLLETSNAWVPGRETVAEATWDAWVAQEEGRTKGQGRILYDSLSAPPDTDLANPESLRSALEFIYRDSPWIDVEAIMRRILSPRARPDDSKRKYLNWPTAAWDAWVTAEQWKRLEAPRDEDGNPTVEVLDRDEIVLFFDGAKSRDATALIGCRVSDGHVFALGVWEPDPSHDADDQVNPAEVDFVVRRTFDRFTVLAFFADVREWESWVLSEWPSRYADDLEVWAQPQSRNPQPIAWDMRAHKYEFAQAAEACHAEILEGAFTHDGDSAVARHVVNARRHPYRDLVSVAKESPDSPRKIDAAVCVIGARMVRRIVLGRRGKTGKRPSRIWV